MIQIRKGRPAGCRAAARNKKGMKGSGVIPIILCAIPRRQEGIWKKKEEEDSPFPEKPDMRS